MSKEHIEREATCKDCFHYDVCANPCTKYYYRVPCRKFVNSADVEPIVHGRWFDEDSFDAHSSPIYRCSVCNRTVADNYISCHKFCLHCGALMDGGKE